MIKFILHLLVSFQLLLGTAWAQRLDTEVSAMDLARGDAIDFRLIPTVSAYQSMCDNKANLPRLEKMENICKVVTQGPLCETIKKKDLLQCDGSLTNPELDLWAYVSGCAKGLFESASDILRFIWDMLNWTVENVTSSSTRGKTIDQASEYSSMAKLYLHTEYEKAYSKSSGPFRELEAARRMGGQVSKAIVGILTRLVADQFKELGCLNQEAQSKVICKFIGDVAIPPAAFFALIKTGLKSAKAFKSVSDALENLGSYQNYFKASVHLRRPSYKAFPMNRHYKGETRGKVFGTKVKYFTKAERLKLKVSFADGKMLDSAGKPLNIENAKYVMDNYGNIFVYEKHKVGHIHHSSLAAGQPVAAAGYVSVKDGVVQMINRRSGHYSPTETMLKQFLNELKSNGVNFSDEIVYGF